MLERDYMNKIKERYDYIDLIKAIAIFFVILIHNFKAPFDFISNPKPSAYLGYMIRLIIEGVPIFLSINGFLIINKEFDFKKHLKKMLNIFLIIIIWSLIYTILFKLIFNEKLYFKDIIYSILTTNINDPYTGILWFLQNLLVLYLIYPILKNIHDTNKKIYNYFFIIVAIFTVGLDFVNSIFNSINLLWKNEYTAWINMFLSIYNPISNGYFILFFMLGGYIFEYKDLLKKHSVKIYIVSIIGFIIAVIYGIVISKMQHSFYSWNFLYNSIFLIPIIVSIFTACFNFKNKNIFTKCLCMIGKKSMGIYLLHIILTNILGKFIFFDSLHETFIFSFLILIACFFLTILIDKIPYLNKIIKI